MDIERVGSRQSAVAVGRQSTVEVGSRTPQLIADAADWRLNPTVDCPPTVDCNPTNAD
jgi:hypothetical protein